MTQALPDKYVIPYRRLSAGFIEWYFIYLVSFLTTIISAFILIALHFLSSLHPSSDTYWSPVYGDKYDAQTTLPWIIPKPEELCPRASIWWDISPSPHMPLILSDSVSLTLSLRLSPESLQTSWICSYPQSQSPGSKTPDSSVWWTTYLTI